MTIFIGIPTFNRADMLRDALRSCEFIKRYEGSVVVVVDNCSTEDIRAVVDEFPWARYERNHTNLGYAGNVNRCLDIGSSYDIIGVLHSDDIYLCDPLPEVCDTFETRSKVAVVFSRYAHLNARLEPVRVEVEAAHEYHPGVEAILRTQRQVPCSGTFLRSSAIRAIRYNLQFEPFSDEEFFARIAVGWSIVCARVTFSGYRNHSGHLMLHVWKEERALQRFIAMKVAINAVLPAGERRSEAEVARYALRIVWMHCSAFVALGEMHARKNIYRCLLNVDPLFLLRPSVFTRMLVHWLPFFGPKICRMLSKNAGA